MDSQREAWETLYSGQARPWRGVADTAWMEIASGQKVLDLGCGNGKTSAALIDRGAVVTGADFSASAVASCVKQYGSKATFVEADMRDMPFPDGEFDCVVSVHALEHVPEDDTGKAVSEILRVMRKGGTLYLRCFAEGDMRSDGRKEDVRNGILYRYFSEDDVREMFSEAEVVSVEKIDEPTRFGTVRRRLHCIIKSC